MIYLLVGVRTLMALQNVIELGVGSVSACIKVDDAVPGIEEGRNVERWVSGFG